MLYTLHTGRCYFLIGASFCQLALITFLVLTKLLTPDIGNRGEKSVSLLGVKSLSFYRLPGVDGIWAEIFSGGEDCDKQTRIPWKFGVRGLLGNSHS